MEGIYQRRERKIYRALEGQKESDGGPPLAVFRSHLIWMRRRHQKMAATGLGDPSRVDFFTSPPPLLSQQPLPGKAPAFCWAFQLSFWHFVLSASLFAHL